MRLTDPAGRVWVQEFDDRFGQVTLVTGPDGATTGFGYDEAGHLASVTDPGGAVTRISCDAAGLPVVVTGPGGASTRYERDGFGQVTRVTGPDGAATELAWTPEGPARRRGRCPTARPSTGTTTPKATWSASSARAGA